MGVGQAIFNSICNICVYFYYYFNYKKSCILIVKYLPETTNKKDRDIDKHFIDIYAKQKPQKKKSSVGSEKNNSINNKDSLLLINEEDKKN